MVGRHTPRVRASARAVIGGAKTSDVYPRRPPPQNQLPLRHSRIAVAPRSAIAPSCQSLRRGGAKIPEIRKHPPETGPKTGLKTASTLSAVEPVSAPPKRKLENRHQRPEPETRPARAEMPEIADQRLGHPSLTSGNVGDSPPPGNNTPETGLAG